MQIQYELLLKDRKSRPEVFCKKGVLIETSQNSQENTCARDSFLITILQTATLLKKSLWHRCFPVNFVKFLRTPFFTEHLRWLLLERGYAKNSRKLKPVT